MHRSLLFGGAETRTRIIVALTNDRAGNWTNRPTDVRSSMFLSERERGEIRGRREETKKLYGTLYVKVRERKGDGNYGRFESPSEVEGSLLGRSNRTTPDLPVFNAGIRLAGNGKAEASRREVRATVRRRRSGFPAGRISRG